MNSYDKERYWYGESTKSDTPGEAALYSYDIMLLSKDLSDEDISSLFSKQKIIVTWIDKKGAEINRNINLEDNIEFK